MSVCKINDLLITGIYLFIPQFRKCIHDDTKYNRQCYSCHNDEKGDIKQHSKPSSLKVVGTQLNHLKSQSNDYT